MELFVTWCFCYGARDEWAAPLEIRVDCPELAVEILVIAADAATGPVPRVLDDRDR